MKEFTLFYALGSEDVQVQFFYSLDTSTPCCTLLTRQRNPRFSKHDDRQPEYKTQGHSRGTEAIDDAKQYIKNVTA